MPRSRPLPKAPAQCWIGYCRKSTDSEDKQIYTLQDQAQMIRDYYARLPAPERQDHPLLLIEEAKSAYHPGRPEFHRIMAKADRGEVLGLIVVHPNRVSRNHADSGAFVQRLVEGTIRYLDTTGGKRYTAGDSNDIFMLTLEGAMSWKDSRDKGDRIYQAMRTRAAEGRQLGPVRIGYNHVFRADGSRVLEVDQQRAPLIRRIFELEATGVYSIQQLRHEAKKLGLKGRRGGDLHGGAVHEMLRDPIYKGYTRFDGIIARGQHEPIVDEGLWHRVQLVLSGRNLQAGKPKDLSLRELFAFGNLICCPLCKHTLSPYRVKGKYIYYECKNVQTDCGICIPQKELLDQIPPLLQAVQVSPDDLQKLRERLLKQHREKSRDETASRRILNEEYEKVQREIGEVFAQRKEAEALGVLDAVDLRLAELKRRRNDLQVRLNAMHEQGTTWIETVIRTFELLNLLQEVLFYGSMRPRELVLKALASNYTVKGRVLLPELRSPFRQAAQRAVCPEWWSSLDDVRTEIFETFSLLEAAYACFQVIT